MSPSLQLRIGIASASLISKLHAGSVELTSTYMISRLIVGSFEKVLGWDGVWGGGGGDLGNLLWRRIHGGGPPWLPGPPQATPQPGKRTPALRRGAPSVAVLLLGRRGLLGGWGCRRSRANLHGRLSGVLGGRRLEGGCLPAAGRVEVPPGISVTLIACTHSDFRRGARGEKFLIQSSTR
jgi:hypothetical protein